GAVGFPAQPPLMGPGFACWFRGWRTIDGMAWSPGSPCGLADHPFEQPGDLRVGADDVAARVWRSDAGTVAAIDVLDIRQLATVCALGTVPFSGSSCPSLRTCQR